MRTGVMIAALWMSWPDKRGWLDIRDTCTGMAFATGFIMLCWSLWAVPALFFLNVTLDLLAPDRSPARLAVTATGGGVVGLVCFRYLLHPTIKAALRLFWRREPDWSRRSHLERCRDRIRYWWRTPRRSRVAPLEN